jgi:hypothetical protein
VLIPLVIDKSFAQASKISRLHELSSQFTLLVPTAFYHELFTTSDNSRRMAAQGFPVFQRVHLPELLRRELETGQPASSIDFNPMTINPMVADRGFRLEPIYSELVERHRLEVVEPKIDFLIETIQVGVPGFSAEDMGKCHGSGEEFAALCSELRDETRLRNAAEEMGYRHASRIDFRWLKYRHLQALLIQALIFRRRHQNPKNEISRKNLEHDVHDLEYLALGLHAGRLATCETSQKLKKMPMKWRFEILEPDGQVFSN